MPGLYDLLSHDRIACKADIGSKKRALQTLADLLAASDPELKPRKVFDQLCARERLGSTGLGHGLAIPHCRMEGIAEPVAALLTLEQPIDFDAVDGQPLDLLVALMVPSEATDTHLNLLAEIAKTFGAQNACESIRQAATPGDILDLLQPAASTG